jgi:hypothetical protein
MKLGDLQSYLNIFKSSDQTFALNRKGRFELSQTQVLEYYYTCLELELFIDLHQEQDDLNDSTLLALMKLLQKRWYRVDQTNSAYHCDPTNPANNMYEQIAEDLEKTMSISKEQFLMPLVLGREKKIVALDDESQIQFLFPVENENAMFATILDDPNSHHLLTLVKFFKLYRELSHENQHRLVMTLLDLGEQGHKHLYKQIKNFDQLFEVLATLNEAEKLRFLASTNVLNKLLKPKGKKRKAEYIEELIQLLTHFEDQRAVLALINEDTLGLYKKFHEIKTLLPEEELIIDLSLMLDADDPILLPPPPRRVIEIDMDEPALPVPVMAEAVPLPTESESSGESPTKKRRIDTDEQQGTSVSLASSTVPTLFNPMAPRSPSRPIDIYRDFVQKARMQIVNLKVLETFYYVRLAYDHLLLNRYEAEWKQGQIQELKKILREATGIMRNEEQWRHGFYFYETKMDTNVLVEMCKEADLIGKELLGESAHYDDRRLYGFLKGGLMSLLRYHPMYPTI